MINQSRVLRVFYVENVFTGMVENKKDRSRVEAHFKNFQRQEDFDSGINAKEAMESIKDRFLPLEGRYSEVDKIAPYVDAFSHKIVDVVECPDKYSPVAERYFEESLLPPVMLAECTNATGKKRRK